MAIKHFCDVCEKELVVGTYFFLCFNKVLGYNIGAKSKKLYYICESCFPLKKG